MEIQKLESGLESSSARLNHNLIQQNTTRRPNMNTFITANVHAAFHVTYDSTGDTSMGNGEEEAVGRG
jgi:hypothetical protein